MTSNKFCSQPPASIRTSASNITATKVFWLVLTWDCLILNHWHLGTRTERKGSTIFLDIWQVWWKCSMACDPPRQFGEVAWQKFGMFVETKSEVCCLWAPGWPSWPRPSPWQSGSPESSQFMDVKFPGRFNAQNQWIQHMALTLNISSIMTMKMFVLLLDGVKTANIQAPADSFEWWRHQESCWAGREASRQSVTQTGRNSFLHIQDPRARNDGQGVRSIQYFHHITMEILSIYSALIMHIISALDLGIMEIYLSEVMLMFGVQWHWT